MINRLIKRIVFIAPITAFAIVPLLTSPAYAASATLYISPSSGYAVQYTNLTVSVRENSGSEPVNAVQANFSYTTSSLQFVSINSSSAFDVNAPSTGGSGSVQIARGATVPVTGDQLVATVNFTVLGGSGTTSLAFTGGSSVVSSNTNTDITSSTPGATYTMAVPPAPSPANAKVTKSTVARTPGSMDVLYQSGTNITDRYWDSVHGWNAVVWPLGAADMPSVSSRSSGNMDVIFRDINNNLVDRWWDSIIGWNTTTLVKNGSVRGDPIIIARTSGNMDIFYHDASNNLVDTYWTSTGGWNTAYWTDGVGGNPAALTRNSGSMDILFRNTGNNLVDRYWNTTNGWNVVALVTGGGDTGDPAVIARTAGNMDVLYKNNGGKLSDRWWDAGIGWNTASWPVAVGGTPVVIARTAGDMDVFIRTPNNSLVDQYWDVFVGWNTVTKDSSSTLTTDPMAIARTSGNMDIFYGNNSGKLVDAWWDQNIGWNAVWWPY